jgi:hypothetical protein
MSPLPALVYGPNSYGPSGATLCAGSYVRCRLSARRDGAKAHSLMTSEYTVLSLICLIPINARDNDLATQIVS